MAVRPYIDKQTGEIVPRKWVIEFYRAGQKTAKGKPKQVKRVVSGVSESQANSLYLKLRGQARNPLRTLDPKVIDKIGEWLTEYRRDHAATTIVDIENALLRLLPHFGQWPFSQLDLSIFEAYLDKRRRDTWRPPVRNPVPDKAYSPGKPISKARINTEMKYLDLYLQWAAKKNYMLPLPFPVPKFKRLPKRTKRLPTVIEVDGLLKNLGPLQRLAVLLYHDAGLRRTEGNSVKAEDVLLDEGLIYTIGKGDKERFVAIATDRLRAALEERINQVGMGSLFFNPKTQAPYKDFNKSIKAAAEKSGISKKIHNHIFRHAYTTNSHEAGVDLETIRLQLGHADLKTTQHYLHSRLKHRIEESRKLQKFLLQQEAGKNKK